MENTKVTEVSVRDVSFKLNTFNKSLELCARMNYETENLDFIDEIKEGEVLFDLGACEGRFSIYAGMKGVETFSFEPEAKNFQTLTDNIGLNSLQNKVTLYNTALGDSHKTGVMNVGQPWAGGHQKIVQHDAIRSDVSGFESKEEQEINIVDLDSFLANNDVPVPDFMKIDIDGSELPFLRGAQKTLGNVKIKGLLFELDKEDPGYDQIIDQLDAFGFSVEKTYPIPNEPTLFNYLFKRR